MKHLLNTLFVTSEDIYLSLDGENVVANRERQEIARYPLHTLDGIISFSYPGASPALMGACAKRDMLPGQALGTYCFAVLSTELQMIQGRVAVSPVI